MFHVNGAMGTILRRTFYLSTFQCLKAFAQRDFRAIRYTIRFYGTPYSHSYQYHQNQNAKSVEKEVASLSGFIHLKASEGRVISRI